jgi:hypothetical protein
MPISARHCGASLAGLPLCEIALVSVIFRLPQPAEANFYRAAAY